MARGLTTAMITAYTGSPVMPVFLVSIGTAGGLVNVWSGYGTLVWNGLTFLGVGEFGAIDTVAETSDLSATSVKFSLAGVDPDFLEIALNEIQQNQSATLWLGALDTSGNLIADPYQLFKGFTDVPEIVESSTTCTITIQCESRLADLNRAQVYYYTTGDQQIFDPDDHGFDYVPSLQDAIISFG